MDSICRIEIKAARKGRFGSSVKTIYDRFDSVHDFALLLTGNIDKTLEKFNRDGFNYKDNKIPNTNWSFLIIGVDDNKWEKCSKIISEVVLNACCKPNHIDDLNAFSKWQYDENRTEGYFKAIIHNQFRLEGYELLKSKEVVDQKTRKRADIFLRCPNK